MENNLIFLSERLLSFTEFLHRKFEEVKLTGTAEDFYKVVKPYSEEVNNVNKNWRQVALKWVDKNQPRQININQIENVFNQIEIISIQAFFPDTSRTRFINYVKTIRYVLQTLLQLLLKK